MSEHEIFQCLRPRFGGNDYALIPQVRNSTGFAGRVRTADAIAVSLWPSRGNHFEGFEFKDSRTDWKKELDDPAKAEEISKYCLRWWVVVSRPEIVLKQELPPTWVLLHAVDGDTKVLAKAKQPMPDPVAPTINFVSALLRAAQSVVIPETEIVRRTEKAKAEARKTAYDEAKRDLDREYGVATTKAQLDALRSKIKAFEQASGIDLNTYHYDGPKIAGETLKYVKAMLDEYRNPAKLIQNHIGCLEEYIATAKAAHAQLSAITANEHSRSLPPGCGGYDHCAGVPCSQACHDNPTEPKV